MYKRTGISVGLLAQLDLGAETVLKRSGFESC